MITLPFVGHCHLAIFWLFAGGGEVTGLTFSLPFEPTYSFGLD
ncbi:hypothetical protein [Vibrio vulnificus YJ016]|uniref:Uncharacterized protein n=1 Tax=Vibrio vulnificus (strain YJ016) TaxID=196600 RepID=Q7MHQ9_VIBVY|nr:hypothetical protein [Vibrio vulnificus YJ016]